jgi:hypothetical protein
MLFSRTKTNGIPNKEIDKALKKVGRLITDGIFVKMKAILCLWFSFSITWYRWKC